MQCKVAWVVGSGPGIKMELIPCTTWGAQGLYGFRIWYGLTILGIFSESLKVLLHINEVLVVKLK